MKKTKTIYWVFTGLVAALLGIGSVFDAISAPEAVEHITRIGYPVYLVPFLGVAKLLGIIAILIPGYPKLKEWAYAGLSYDLIGAIYSHLSFGDGPKMWAGLIIGLVLIAGSYIFYHKKQSETAYSA
ncbi:DoxX family protein [Dyadobacter pollutisoli]|uniref:DoxX family protein n=1 Tax=Dyadobacter pollutisoli TaxID=2910158 RepID=A0A9E8ND73_9BACT|nr:DoxX family protein [Dyadobacter pollutisoli]WAC14510.1 DoxX family protein [Dyadobacter pollutisoli]